MQRKTCFDTYVSPHLVMLKGYNHYFSTHPALLCMKRWKETDFQQLCVAHFDTFLFHSGVAMRDFTKLKSATQIHASPDVFPIECMCHQFLLHLLNISKHPHNNVVPLVFIPCIRHPVLQWFSLHGVFSGLKLYVRFSLSSHGFFLGVFVPLRWTHKSLIRMHGLPKDVK